MHWTACPATASERGGGGRRQQRPGPLVGGGGHAPDAPRKTLGSVPAPPPLILPPSLPPRLPLRRAGTLPLLLDVIHQEAAHFGPVHTSHALHRLAKMHAALFTRLHATQLASSASRESTYYEYVQPALLMLNKLVVKHLAAFEPWNLAQAIWAYGNLEHSDEVLWASSGHGV